MIFAIFSIIFLWFFRTIKFVLFYLYLWQLKEYQVKRFVDHFRTTKGKKVLANKVNIVKIITFIVFFFSATLFFYLVFAVYLFEFLKFILDIIKKRTKKPVFTKKIILLFVTCLVVLIYYVFLLFNSFQTIFWFPFFLLIFDILTPLIISLVVLVFQPLAVFLRNRIIKKAKKKIKKFDIIKIGITGSFGKTSTKEILSEILSTKFNVLKTKNHQNSEVGIANCILNELNETYQVFVAEMGAYGRGGIKLLADIVGPKIGILTGISDQHLALYGSQEKIIKTKFELIDSLPEDGIGILNIDNEYIKENKKNYSKNFKLCSQKKEADVWAENIKVSKDGVSFKVYLKNGESADFRANFLGEHIIINILLAVSCSIELGMSLSKISKDVKKIKGNNNIIKKEKATIIDSSYSSNFNGVMADLEYLKQYEEKKIIIMPCLIELGSKAKEDHKKIGKKISEVCDLAIITTREYFKEIKGQKDNIILIEDPLKIRERVKNLTKEKSVILLEGRVPKNII